MADNTIAHGFIDFRHVMAERINEIGVDKIITAIQQSFDEHTRQLDGLMASFVERTTDHQRRWKMPRHRTLQPIDDLGVPMPGRGSVEYSLGFPIQGGADAYGLSRKARVTATVEDVNEQVLAMQHADGDWLIRHMLVPLFNGNQWTFVDEDKGDILVEGLANGDSVKYLLKNGTQATATGYKFQAGTIGNSANPFETIATYLRQYAVNAGATIVCYINNNERADTEALTNFVDPVDANLMRGEDQDRATGAIDLAWGEELVGYIKKARVWVVESHRVPAEYVLGEARGTGSAPVAMREYPEAALQGLRPESHVFANQTIQYNGIRFAGFGAWNRVGACVVQVENGSYVVPTDYASPPIP